VTDAIRCHSAAATANTGMTPERQELPVRTALIAAVAASLFAASAASAAPPQRDRFPVEGQFDIDPLSQTCGFPVSVAIEGTFSIVVFQDRDGAVTREIDTQPGTLLTYVSDSGEISFPFSGVLHTRYPEGAVVGAPAELVVTGNSGPFSGLVPLGSGRVVLAGFVAEVEDGFAFTRFTSVISATGDFTGQTERICAALAP
jgi:hypothetical protein